MKKGDKTRIVIGSCNVYSSEYTGAIEEILTVVKNLCVEENRLGYVKGGAEVVYTPTFYKADDDLGLVSKSAITKEEAVVKSGIMTISPDMLKVLSATGRVTDVTDPNTKKGYKLLKVGGIKNNDGKSYVIILHHEDPIDGDLYVIIVGKNEAGFTLQFQQDKETVVDAEFKCAPQDNEGTLISVLEEVVDTAVEEPTETEPTETEPTETEPTETEPTETEPTEAEG